MSNIRKPNHPKLKSFIADQKAKGVIVNITKRNTIVPISVARECTKFVAKK